MCSAAHGSIMLHGDGCTTLPEAAATRSSRALPWASRSGKLGATVPVVDATAPLWMTAHASHATNKREGPAA
jgi:hypothetical protein